MAPWAMRHKMSVSSDPERPHIKVANEKPAVQATITLRRPKFATSHPVIGVATAVANILNVMTQEASSAVADIEPWIWGNTVEATIRVVKYNVTVRTPASKMSTRRKAGISSAVVAAVVMVILADVHRVIGK